MYHIYFCKADGCTANGIQKGPEDIVVDCIF